MLFVLHSIVVYDNEIKRWFSDGFYYVTVRALNKIDYGGPMAVTVCHYLPYVIDNTPPEIPYIGIGDYNTTLELLQMQYNAR